MSVWSNFRSILAAASERSGIRPCLDKAFQSLASLGREPKEVAFTVALVALSAKMAKADGIVTADEIGAFRRVVDIPEGEERSVARLFDLAKADVAGYEAYATRIVRLAEGDQAFLGSVLDGLFHIAAADSYIHEAELAFLENVGSIFGIVDRAFERVVARHIRRRSDPYRMLGVDPTDSDEAIRRRWRTLVLETHPDRHAGRQLSPQQQAELTDRFTAINAAWDDIRAERGLS